MDYKALLSSCVGSADLVLTDPPYAISRDSGFTRGGDRRYAKHVIDFGEWDHKEIDLYDLAFWSFEALRTGGTAIVFYDLWKIESLANALTKAGFKQLRFLEWIKESPVPVNSTRNYLSNAREVAVSAVKDGKPTFNSKMDNGVYMFHSVRGKERVHPTQKPDRLMEALVAKHSNEGDLVIDPFCGSGTTGVAAVGLGRGFAGSDLSADYVAAAKERIKAAENKARRLV